MSLLPKKETDIAALVEVGYEVTYSGSDDDSIEDVVNLYDAIKETVRNKDGEIDAPGDEPSVKYFDKESGGIFAALWIKKGKLNRFNAPAAICDRSDATGAAKGLHYIIRAYYRDDDLHNARGAALTSDDMNEKGEMIRTQEDYFERGMVIRRIRRDPETGNVIDEDAEDTVEDVTVTNKPKLPFPKMSCS